MTTIDDCIMALAPLLPTLKLRHGNTHDYKQALLTLMIATIDAKITKTNTLTSDPIPTIISRLTAAK